MTTIGFEEPLYILSFDLPAEDCRRRPMDKHEKEDGFHECSVSS